VQEKLLGEGAVLDHRGSHGKRRAKQTHNLYAWSCIVNIDTHRYKKNSSFFTAPGRRCHPGQWRRRPVSNERERGSERERDVYEYGYTHTYRRYYGCLVQEQLLREGSVLEGRVGERD